MFPKLFPGFSQVKTGELVSVFRDASDKAVYLENLFQVGTVRAI